MSTPRLRVSWVHSTGSGASGIQNPGSRLGTVRPRIWILPSGQSSGSTSLTLSPDLCTTPVCPSTRDPRKPATLVS